MGDNDDGICIINEHYSASWSLHVAADSAVERPIALLGELKAVVPELQYNWLV